jgi:hypothetical protein
MQISHHRVMDCFASTLDGHEETLLNGLWIGLLGLECLMVGGVVVRGFVRMLKPRSKIKELGGGRDGRRWE